MEVILNMLAIWFITSIPVSLIVGKYLASNPSNTQILVMETAVHMADAS